MEAGGGEIRVPAKRGATQEPEATEPPLNTLRAAGSQSDVRPSPRELSPSSKSKHPREDAGER